MADDEKKADAEKKAESGGGANAKAATSEPAAYVTWQTPGGLRKFVEAMKREFGDNDDLVKQTVGDLHAIERQGINQHFEARKTYVQQQAQLNQIAHEGIREYGMQTLKWSFILNTGAIGVGLGYLTGILGRPPSASDIQHFSHAGLLKALVPFALGSACVVIAGAAAFFNFSYAEASQPSPEQLHNFLGPRTTQYPGARLQQPNESAHDFYKRFSRKVPWSRNVAIAFTVASGLCFLIGVGCVIAIVLG